MAGDPSNVPSDAVAGNKTRVSRSCLACGASGVANRCGGCRRVYFCDRDCQRTAWAAHRPDCQRIQVDAQEEDVTPLVDAVNTDVRIPDAGVRGSVSQEADEEDTATAVDVKEPAEAHATPPCASAAKKKSKHKHKRKKPRSKSLHLPSTLAPGASDGPNGASDANTTKNASSGSKKKLRSVSLGARKHVMWGHVSAREFERFPGGGGAVPYDGTWALGLGSKVADVQLGSVLEVEQLKAEALQARVKQLPKPQRALVREGETRQFDYRRGVDNPLFSRLTERERKQLFTSEPPPASPPSKASSSPPKHDGSHRHHHHHSGRRRKGSVSLSPALLALSSPVVIDDAPLDAPDFACVSIEQLDEFAKIRDSRDAACGCSCGDLGKKVAKMTVRKLAAFLHERGVADTHGMAKPQLLALAKELASQEKNCQDPNGDCECARNGVPCHSDACEGCAGDCFNPLNCYEYKKDEVRAYRKQVIADWRKQVQPKQPAGNVDKPAIDSAIEAPRQAVAQVA